MAETGRRLRHRETPDATDETRRTDARLHLSTYAPAQVCAELLGKLRTMRLRWWTPDTCNGLWPPQARMRWLAQRPDLRQAIVTSLTGLPAKTARAKTADFQADLIVSVVQAGDVTLDEVEAAFDPSDLAIYGPAEEFWHQFVSRLPFDERTPEVQELVAWMMRTLLSARSTVDGASRKPILTPWDVCMNICGTAWQTHLPVDIRAAVDDARLRQEKARPRDPFAAHHELTIATPEVLSVHLPPRELLGVFSAGARALGFEKAALHLEDDAPPSRTSSGITVRRLAAA